METPEERLVRYIQDAHATELGILEMLQHYIEESPPLDAARSIFVEHRAVTESQAARLEERLKALGAEPSGGKGFFSALMAKVNEMLHGSGDIYDKTTQNLIKAYATEHFEQGVYSSLIGYAEACGDHETVNLAEEILSEEEEAAIKIFPMIEQCAQRAYDATASES